MEIWSISEDLKGDRLPSKFDKYECMLSYNGVDKKFLQTNNMLDINHYVMMVNNFFWWWCLVIN